MSLWRLIERSLSQRKLSSTLTAMSVALGVMLVAAILSMQKELDDTYLKQGEGYSVILGPAGGSKLELVLNTVFHVDQSSGIMPFSVYKELKGPAWDRKVRLAVPYALGDSFRGYRVVATTNDVFSPEFPYPRAETTADKFAEGRPFRCEPDQLAEALKRVRRGQVILPEGPSVKDKLEKGNPFQMNLDPNKSDKDGPGEVLDIPQDDGHVHGPGGHTHCEDLIAEAVLGWEVARKLGVSIGDQIEPTHGVEGDHEHEHEHLWTVTGILKETRSPIDKVVFINLDSFYNIPEHIGGRMPITNEAALSAVLVFPVGIFKPSIIGIFTNRPEVQVAEVGREIQKLLGIVGEVDMIFLIVAVLVVIIGVVSIMVAIYNTMNERRRELAILRAIGARRSTVIMAIVGESTALAASGGLAGILMAHIALWLASGYVESISGLRLDPLRVLPAEIGVAALVTVAGALAGLLPAWEAYRTDVARNLAPLS